MKLHVILQILARTLRENNVVARKIDGGIEFIWDDEKPYEMLVKHAPLGGTSSVEEIKAASQKEAEESNDFNDGMVHWSEERLESWANIQSASASASECEALVVTVRAMAGEAFVHDDLDVANALKEFADTLFQRGQDYRQQQHESAGSYRACYDIDYPEVSVISGCEVKVDEKTT